MNRRVINRQPILEVIALDTADAHAAEQGGADRIELVSAMTEGGLTPSYGQMEQVISKVSIPVYVMIRPHSRSFCYSTDDLRVMNQDIRVARELGAAGIVIGALTQGGKVDKSFLQACLSNAQGMGITFHRAIDSIASVARALETIGSIKGGTEGKSKGKIEGERVCESRSRSERSVIQRVLTSGGKPTVPEGLVELQQLQQLGHTLNIAIMAGSGVTIEGISTLVSRTGITETHMGSGVRRGGDFYHPVDAQLVAQAKTELIRAVKELQQ